MHPECHASLIDMNGPKPTLAQIASNSSSQPLSGHSGSVHDCLTYAFAAREPVGLDLGRREEELASVTGEKKQASVIRSKWIRETGFW